MVRIAVDAETLPETISYFETLPDVSAKAMRLAINQVASRSGLNLARDSIMDQVTFPKDYLKGDRLYVGKYARENSLEAIIVARKRATSLARFAQGQPLGRNRMGVRVNVKNGGQVLRKAWLVRLRKGASMDEDNYNVGLAVRVKPGESISEKYSKHTSWLVPNQVALLYGPSVDQIFSDVASDIASPIGDMVTAEFFRQFQRLA